MLRSGESSLPRARPEASPAPGTGCLGLQPNRSCEESGLCRDRRQIASLTGAFEKPETLNDQGGRTAHRMTFTNAAGSHLVDGGPNWRNHPQKIVRRFESDQHSAEHFG